MKHMSHAMNKRIAILFFLFTLGSQQAAAQNGSAVHILPVDGYSPLSYLNEHFGSYYDSRRDRIYWHTNDSLHMWDMSDRKWTFIRETRFEDSELVMDIDTLNNRVLLWAGGAGHVYAVDIDWNTDPIRIDKSSQHRNQFEHGHLISPIDGRIILFGGYGFWQDKNILTYFDEAKGQWDITLWNGSLSPSKRILPALSYWKKENKIVLFGGRASKEPEKPYVTFRATIYDIWTFDQSTSVWKYHGDLTMNEDEISDNYLMLGYMITQRNGLLQDENLLIGMDYHNSNERNTVIYAVDLETMQGSFLDIPTGSLSKLNRLIAYFLNEEKRQIYILWTPMVTNKYFAPIYVSTIDLPPADTIRANIRSMVKMANTDWQEPQELSTSSFLFPILMIGVAVPTYLYWQRRRRSKKHGTTSQPHESELDSRSWDETIRILPTKSGATIIHGGIDISINFSPDEIDLFLLLAKQFLSSNKYLSTEQIEQAIWESGTNPDYSRKMRNQVQRKLEDNLQFCLPKKDGSLWLLSRSEPSDKRRKEYALNPEPYKIDLDTIN